MGYSKLSRLDRTLPSVKGSYTYNAPANFTIPYGRAKFAVTGRAQPGNPSTPGNFAGVNPPTPGNYAGTNPPEPGFSGVNPPEPGNYAGTNPGSPVPGNTNASATNWYAIYSYNDGFPNFSFNLQGGFSPSGSCPSPFDQYYVTPLYNVYSIVNYDCLYNPSTFSPGNPIYNPETPGYPFSNNPTPGYDFFNPESPGNPFFNFVAGNPGSSFSVGNVFFPGGNSDSSAPLVPSTTVAISYTNSGLSLSVPSGGYVTITVS